MKPLDVVAGGLVAGDGVITLRPALSTSAPSLRPDLGPGADNRDTGLDQAAAEVAPHRPGAASGPTAGEERAGEDLVAPLARARADLVDEQLVPLPGPLPHDPLLDLPKPT